jgi:hypothetical protein
MVPDPIGQAAACQAQAVSRDDPVSSMDFRTHLRGHAGLWSAPVLPAMAAFLGVANGRRLYGFDCATCARRMEEDFQREKRERAPASAGDFQTPALLDSDFAAGGIVGRVAFRGLAFVLLSWQFHSRFLAGTVCVISFGIAHMIQGWRGVLGTSIIAVVMHGLVFLTGGLYLPIAVHAAYDLIVGFVAVRAFTQQDASRLAASQSAT